MVKPVVDSAKSDPCMNLAQAATYCGYGKSTLRNAIRVRELLPVRAPGRSSKILIQLSELNRWLNSRKAKTSRAKAS
jgi:hypothetical protein